MNVHLCPGAWWWVEVGALQILEVDATNPNPESLMETKMSLHGRK